MYNEISTGSWLLYTECSNYNTIQLYWGGSLERPSVGSWERCLSGVFAGHCTFSLIGSSSSPCCPAPWQDIAGTRTGGLSGKTDGVKCLEMVNAVGCELTHDLQRFQTPFRSWSPETVIKCCAALVEIRLFCAKFLGPKIHWFPVISNLFSWGFGCPNVWNIHIDHSSIYEPIYIYIIREYVYVYTYISYPYSLPTKNLRSYISSNLCVFFSNSLMDLRFFWRSA